jgi:hypothetical protein
MILKFVRDQFPHARFARIYDASKDGWKIEDFHRFCDKKGWTITIIKTSVYLIFGGFTTAEWESASPYSGISKRDPHSFLFSLNEGSKYPITSGGRTTITCVSGFCAWFGGAELVIASDSNNNTGSYCNANRDSYKLPVAKGSEGPSINGGERDFQLKQFEVYKVSVRKSLLISYIGIMNGGRVWLIQLPLFVKNFNLL